MGLLQAQLGVRTLLLAGPVPVPAPQEVVESLMRAEITSDADRGDGFQLSFAARKGLLDYTVLQTGALDPFNRIVIGVVLGAVPEVLIDGIITHREIQPSSTDPGIAMITVTGRDVSVMMDLEEKNAQFPNLPDFAIFSQIIASYAQYGLVPQPTPTSEIPIMLQRVPRQAETDFQFIQRLARRNGYVSFVEPVTFGVNRAYFGPPARVGLPQPALSVDMGPETNVNSLHFSHDSLAPTSTQGSFIEPLSRTALPVPSLPSLRVPPLSASAATPRRTTLLRSSANESPTLAASSGLAASMNTADPLTATGELDVSRYAGVLRARQLVGVRGVGFAHSGTWYTRQVTHRIERGRYAQSFTLSREGTGALPPVVRP